MKRWIFALCCFFIGNMAYAKYDILLENNTPHTLYINTGVLDPISSKAYGGWHGQQLEPYQRGKVQWFNFNDHIDFNTRYTFFIEARRSLEDVKPAFVFKTTIKGFLIGSSITKAVVETEAGAKTLLNGEPKPHFSVLRTEHLAFKRKKQPDLDVRADAIKYLVPNPHKNIQLTDAISYVINEEQPMYHHSDDANELTVLSYNMQVFPFIVGTTGRIIMNHPEQRVKDIARKAADYDVMTTQELFANEQLKAFTQLMAPNFPYHAGPRRDYHPFTSGVAIYSRWPILDSDTMAYKHCAEIDCGAAKGVTYAKIEKYGKRYNIFSTHLQAGSNVGDDGQSPIVIRQQELEEAKRFIESKHIPKDEAVIFTGDLNIDAAACYEKEVCSELEFLLNILQASYHKHDNRDIVPYATNSVLNWMSHYDPTNKKMLDYILVSNAYRPVKNHHSRVLVLRGDNDSNMYTGEPYGDTDLSDHFALEAKLQF